MKTYFIIFILLVTVKLRAQILLSGPINVYTGPDIPHEEKWTTGILSASNLFVSYINIKQMKNTKRRSNAGFLLFPGLIQLGVGSFYKKQDDPTRRIDIAVGATSALICIARMVYPRKKARENLSLVPYYLPGNRIAAGGFCFKWKL